MNNTPIYKLIKLEINFKSYYCLAWLGSEKVNFKVIKLNNFLRCSNVQKYHFQIGL
jgi:hypothetical protein